MLLLSNKTIRDKLLTYFNNLSIENSSKTFELPLSLTDLSDYLMIERTAMMRELKRLKDEKIIKKVKNKITVL
jgi:CRP-like cAMP-binding protein